MLAIAFVPDVADGGSADRDSPPLSAEDRRRGTALRATTSSAGYFFLRELAQEMEEHVVGE